MRKSLMCGDRTRLEVALFACQMHSLFPLPSCLVHWCHVLYVCCGVGERQLTEVVLSQASTKLQSTRAEGN